MQPAHGPDGLRHARSDLARLALGALGVVYGDIGTSPLYAARECFTGQHGVAATHDNVLGIISLILWSLILAIAVKYIGFIMRADHDGEGGVFALMARIVPASSLSRATGHAWWMVVLGLAGAGLLYGDGVITPAISVQSAVEGLEVATTALEPAVIPITVAILVALFLIQRRGTGRIGAMFGPAMLLWFAAIGIIGAVWVFRAPEILWAFDPRMAVRFFAQHGIHGVVVLGAVMLCITGGEALYADMGHFGRRPITIAWYAVAFPGLLLNYLGQGALLLTRGSEATHNPFYAMIPGTLLYPMVVVATLATVIASQALISGAFSLTRQAVQLGFLPRLHIVHTSGKLEGQIYVPAVNAALMVACVTIVIAFGSSSKLAAAYGIAVTGAMAITSLLFFSFARERWGLGWAVALLVLFLFVDLSFLSANIVKIPQGGWFPLAVAAAVFAVMTTWKRGRLLLGERVRESTLPIDTFLEDIDRSKPVRVPGTAVFMTLMKDVVPVALLHHFKHNQVLHEQVVLLTIVTDHVPDVPQDGRLTVRALGCGFFQVIAHYGFMQTPNVPEIMARAEQADVHTDLSTTSFYLGRETLIVSGTSRMNRWRAELFSVLSQNARPPTMYFGIPANRVVELGAQIQL